MHTSNSKHRDLKKLIIYTLYGVLFGVLFPLAAWAFEFYSASLPLTRASLRAIHEKNTMLYMIDTAPFFLGLFAFIAARYKVSTDNYSEKLEAMVNSLEHMVQERTLELEIANENLNKSYLQASASAHAQSAFLANMSHEIRTPMNAIIGMAVIAQKNIDKPEQKEKIRRSIDQIQVSSRHLLGLINNILDLSKIEAGEFSLSEEDFSLEELVAETEQIILPRCMEKNVHLYNTLEGTKGLWLKGDKLRIMQVLINLIGNAVKFTPPGGRVTLAIKAHKSCQDAVVLHLAVHDTGIGMSQSVMDVIFQPFKQADDKAVRKAGGTGLGLAISQNIVNLMGSEIALHSVLGQGSTFSFDLTLPKGTESAQEEPELVAANLSFAGKRILLVDDIDVNRLIVQELLEDTNLAIDTADDGSVAVEMVKQSSPGYYDLIFMDVQMPAMDGYTATKILRQLDRPDALTVPIIAMTANAMKEDEEKARASQMNGHIAKPIDQNKLLAVLQSYLA